MSPEAGGAIPRLRSVPLQELRLRADALVWRVEQKLADLDSLTPVRGQVRARHHGGVLEVEGEAETIVTLCCDRCLQHFNRPLQATVHELLELAGGGELESSDLTALAGSAAGTDAPRARFRPTGLGAGASGASAPGRRAADRPPAAGRDRGRRDAAAGSDLSPSRSSGHGKAPSSSPSSGSQPRRESRSRTHPEPLLIEALDDRLDPRGDFDPERWLFEQLSLQLPVVNRCGADCPGPPQARGNVSTITLDSQQRNPAPQAADAAPSSSAQAPVLPAGSASHSTNTSSGAAGPSSLPPSAGPPNALEAEPTIDPRWAALRQLLP